MTNRILSIDASMRKSTSHGRKLLDRLIARLTEHDCAIKTRDLSEGIPIINDTWIDANVTKSAKRSPEQRSILSLSDALINELREAEIIAMAVPIYNFNVPAAFKAWLDLVARSQETFKYTEHGPVGLLENKRAIIIVTSGGTKLGSQIDFVSAYLKHVMGFIGIHKLTIVDASGLGSNLEIRLQQAWQTIDQLSLPE